MKSTFILFTTFTLLFSILQGQNEVKKIETGAILFRLETNIHILNYYKEHNLLNQADIIKKANNNTRIIYPLETPKLKIEIDKQNDENKNIVTTFAKEWSLCPIYFFYSNFSDQIMNNNFENVFKSNHDLLNMDEKDALKNNFLIAYIGDSPGTLKFHSLVVVDNQFQTLPKPYPKYVRTYKGLWFLERKLDTSIKILEKKMKFALSRIK